MFRRLTKLISGALASLALVGVAGAVAFSVVPMKEKATGTLSTIVPGHLSYAGQGTATHLGNYTFSGNADFDGAGNVSNGQFTQIAADGSTLSGTYSGTFAPLPNGTLRFDLALLWTSGTGRFVGATGQGNLVAFLDAPLPGASFHYQAVGELSLP